jgi:CAAX prenyl protease-like protein
MSKSPLIAYAGPFALFMLLLVAVPPLGLPPTVDLAVRLVLPSLLVLAVSRHLLEWKFSNLAGSVAMGLAVFALWIGPDLLIPGYREHWLFQNSITGKLEHSVPPAAFLEPLNVALRVLRAALLVPVVEELFWRGFLMRWLINQDFLKVPLGAYQFGAFWITAGLFAVEHGPYWEVGLLAGVAYNWWMIRTKRLSDLILAHAVTNLCLAVFVLVTKRWEFWM